MENGPGIWVDVYISYLKNIYQKMGICSICYVRIYRVRVTSTFRVNPWILLTPRQPTVQIKVSGMSPFLVSLKAAVKCKNPG